jgi:hypothetical protein
MITRLYAIAIALTISALVGCQQETVVSGTVTYNGQPVEKGMVSFKPSGGTGQSFGAPIENGAYEAKQAKPGAWTAVIVGVKRIDFAMSSDEAAKKANEQKMAGSPLAGHVSEAADYIPENAEGNSKTVDITSGLQTIDFEVKGPPRS